MVVTLYMTYHHTGIKIVKIILVKS